MSDATGNDGDPLWVMEKRFWLDGADFYEGSLADGATMVFPYPAGILDRDGVMAGLESAPRWRNVEMTDLSLQVRGVTAVLAYRVTAWRRGDEDEIGENTMTGPYEALCASTYIRDGDDWLMLGHSQQPLGVAADPTVDA